MLKCYRIDNTDWVIALSKKDAILVWCETTGEKPEDYFDSDNKTLEEVSPEKELTILDDPYNLTSSQTKKIEDWIKLMGRCFLCSTEY